LSAEAAEIKAAFRRKATELHPDRNASASATEQFQLLNEAYSILSDPVLRARYDTISIETNPKHSTSSVKEETPEPIACSCCGKISAQPRYVIFYEVKSFIFVTTRSPVQGIFCSACAERKSFRATAITWLLGWWGIPWGPIYSIQAIFSNMFGGKHPTNINARLAAHQALVFAIIGKTDMARAIALDAMALARKIKPDGSYAKVKNALGYDVPGEGTELRAQIRKLLDLLGDSGSGKLKDAWGVMRRPFFVQAIVVALVFGSLGFSIQYHTSNLARSSAKSYTPPKGPKPYVADAPLTTTDFTSTPPPVKAKRGGYVRPATAPNGQNWPDTASYINGFQRLHTSGLSQVTVDNKQNDSDVFVKLVTLDGPSAYPVRTFFIPAYGSFTINKVTAGRYDIRYKDLSGGGLSRSEPFNLEETRTYDGTQYSKITMTLYKVRNGNMKTYDLSEDEF
jgi:hypothetical protein